MNKNQFDPFKNILDNFNNLYPKIPTIDLPIFDSVLNPKIYEPFMNINQSIVENLLPRFEFENQYQSLINSFNTIYFSQIEELKNKLSEITKVSNIFEPCLDSIKQMQDVITNSINSNIQIDEDIYISEELSSDVYNLLEKSQSFEQSQPQDDVSNHTSIVRKPRLTISEAIAILTLIFEIIQFLCGFVVEQNTPTTTNNYDIDIHIDAQDSHDIQRIIDELKTYIEPSEWNSLYQR